MSSAACNPNLNMNERLRMNERLYLIKIIIIVQGVEEIHVIVSHHEIIVIVFVISNVLQQEYRMLGREQAKG